MTGITRRKVLVLAALVVVGLGLQTQVSGGDLFRRIFSRSKCRSSGYTYQRQPVCCPTESKRSLKYMTTGICPIYKWAEHIDELGNTYCSYYAIDCNSYFPYNLDGACDLDLGCGGEGCTTTLFSTTALFYKSAPFPRGNALRRHKTKPPSLRRRKKHGDNLKLLQDPSFGVLKKLYPAGLIVACPYNTNGDKLYAKLFLALLTPKKPDQGKKYPPTLLAVGWEIEKPPGNVPVIELKGHAVDPIDTNIIHVTIGSVTHQVVTVTAIPVP